MIVCTKGRVSILVRINFWKGHFEGETLCPRHFHFTPTFMRQNIHLLLSLGSEQISQQVS